MQEINYVEAVERIVQNDPRYHRDAYQFLRDALDYTQRLVNKQSKTKPRHVTGQELLEGLRQFGLEQFGPMTLSVFNAWGIFRGEDFGELVFNLVENELLSKTETDSRADFQGGYDFFDAFRKPFLPTRPPSSSVEPALPKPVVENLGNATRSENEPPQ
ncbi:MAG: hypothetical protein HY043_01550 [Verrucomicrobia bacterium]|nr:hypothetical protein [Verrucomicrobiota bacterium]